MLVSRVPRGGLTVRLLYDARLKIATTPNGHDYYYVRHVPPIYACACCFEPIQGAGVFCICCHTYVDRACTTLRDRKRYCAACVEGD